MKAKIIFVLMCLFLLVSCGGGDMADSESMESKDGMSEYPEAPAEEPPSSSPYEKVETPQAE